MADQTISNPAAAYQTVSDYRLGKDDSGNEIAISGKQVELFVAGAAHAVGTVVALASPTSATVGARTAAGTASTRVRNLGVVQKASAAAGDVIPVVTEGLAFALLGGDVTANDTLSVDANGAVVTEATDATDIVGSIIGYALATKTSGTLCPIYVAKR